MEEVDKIIIESLRHLKCNIDEDVKSIKDFDSDMVVDAVVSCLEVITPDIKMSHKLSPSMSLRLKLATSLAEHIKELGFRGDIGYQTILYCNEIEVRRMLMFLIERLPRESDEDIPIQQTGYVHNLIKQIEEKVKLSLQKSWIPSLLVQQGIRDCGKDYIKLSTSSMHPLQTENIHIPYTQNCDLEDLKEYWLYFVEDITKQCSIINLIPSLLFKDCDFCNVNSDTVDNSFDSKNMTTTDIVATSSRLVQEIGETKNIVETYPAKVPIYSVHEDKIQQLLQGLERQRLNIAQLKDNVKAERHKLLLISDTKEKEEELLAEMLSKYKVKSRTLTVLSKEDNLTKLKNLVQNGNDRLTELTNQWKEVQIPLLQEYESLRNRADAIEVKQHKEQEKIKNIRDKRQQLLDELRNKEKLEKLLTQERERLSKNTRRSAYTRRILEIIGNIRKQNEEIQKILHDTKVIQKEINSLNGQLDRSFTLSDELIFRNAKQDEMSRKAYKLLAALHNDCGSIIQAITEIGITERESRNLQEQIDTEVSKATGVSLERVNADLQNVRKETAALLEQIQF